MQEDGILFLCPHGGAKSVMAAAWFNRLAEGRNLPFRASAAATEEPYEAIPAPVAGLLERDGIDVQAFRPRAVDEQELIAAAKVVSIGCALPAGTRDVERWDDVPAASEDLDASASAIRRHVMALVEDLGAGR